MNWVLLFEACKPRLSKEGLERASFCIWDGELREVIAGEGANGRHYYHLRETETAPWKSCILVEDVEELEEGGEEWNLARAIEENRVEERKQ